MCRGRDFPPGDGVMDVMRLWGDMVGQGRQGVLATVVSASADGPATPGAKLLLTDDDRRLGSVGGGRLEQEVLTAAGELMTTGGTRLLRLAPDPEADGCGGTVEVFLESLRQGYPFWILGAGHVGRAVVSMGAGLALRFMVCDDRPEQLAPVAEMPGVRTERLEPEAVAGLLEPGPRAAVLIAGPTHDLDFAYLQAVLTAEEEAGRRFGFLGLLGSRRKVDRLIDRLAAWPDRQRRVRAAQMPVGLEIGDGSASGIALAILAEAVAVLNGCPYLEDGQGPLGVRLRRRRG